MKTTAVAFTGLLLAAVWLNAQPDRDLTAETFVPTLAARPEEALLLPELKGVVILAVPPHPDETLPAASGVDAEDVPLLRTDAFALEMSHFLRQPVSAGSIERLQHVIRTHLQLIGRPLARVYAPPQDITDGTVRIVVQLASLDGDVRVDGNQWFARERYTSALRVRAGEALDVAALNADLAWLNRNPFTRVTPVVEAGEQPGTTRVTLRAEERFPLTLNAAYSNGGTPNTGEDRVSAGVQWGNAFGRGDLLSLGASGDPAWEHLRGYHAGYTAFLPWRHIASLQAAYSRIESVLPEPFTQEGRSWQVAARYEIPLAGSRAGWTQTLSFGADFKYSDNTLEFAALPVTDNVTHLVQGAATYTVTFPALGGQNSARAELVASPGGLTDYNDDAAFAGARPGADATYGYARIGLRHQRELAPRWMLVLSTDAQLASGALLGSEQLNGGGASAVRGYRENSAFGDGGLLGTAELHAPAFAVVRGRDRADVFGFVDAAWLQLDGDDDTDLASVGVGVNYQFGRHFGWRAAYGWQLTAVDSSRADDSGHGHVSANLSW